jgi:DNA-binding transcriptional MocR family regulator
MAAAGHARPEDDLLITSGCQQGLDLVAKVLVAPGETVLLEDPVYPGARDLFLAAGVQVRGVAVGPMGISTTELEHELTRWRPRLLVVTPNFQNPTGATLPLEARREILRLAARFQAPVVENDVYAGLRYRGEELPSLKSLDGEGLVIYLRSFSKAAFPGLRVGWCVAPHAVIRRLAAAKQLTDLHTDQLSQAVLHRLAVEGVLDQHLEALRAEGAGSLEAALEAASPLDLTAPEGGAHLWVRLPEPLEAAELLVRARDQGVVFIPGRYFAVTRPHAGALRLTFAGLAPDQIRRGIAVLARLVATLAPAAQSRSEGGVPALV